MLNTVYTWKLRLKHNKPRFNIENLHILCKYSDLIRYQWGLAMLIEFKVTNFRSIKDTQTFSMVASADKDLPENIHPSEFDEDLNVVRSAAIYGANAAGKSNLITSLGFIKNLVLNSAKESQQGEQIEVESFIFNEQTRMLPSEFEVTFSKHGVRYQYGCIVGRECIFEEWLLAYPQGRPQLWFERNVKNNKKFKFGENFKGVKKILEESTRSNSLFLSTAIHLNNEQLKPVFEWFQKDLQITFSKETDFFKTVSKLENLEEKNRILELINIADSNVNNNIVDVEISRGKPNIPESMPDSFKGFFNDIIVTDVVFVYKSGVSLPYKYMSDGTKNLFCQAGYWIDLLRNGGVFVVDEFENSLHPNMALFILNLLNSKINNKNSQLVFSTHNTNFLDADILRRDQIWFVEKDKDNASHLYPLLDFSPRKTDFLGKRYLEGRYGAISYFGDWSF